MLALVIVASLLAGCAEDQGSEEDRRFANQPVTEEPTRVGQGGTPRPASEPTPVPLPSPESLLDVRGAPSIVYALVNDQVLALDTTDPSARSWIPLAAGMRVVDLVSSPSGDRVALLEVPHDGTTGAAEVVIHSADGAAITGWQIPAPARPEASPLPAGAPGTQRPGSITWSADGVSLLVTSGGHSLVSIDVNGDANAIDVPGNVASFSDAAWSPAGDRIALLARDDGGAGRIMAFDPDAPNEPARQLVPPTADTSGQGSVARFAWLPNGSGLAYLMTDLDRGPGEGGALYVLDVSDGGRRLVATPGRVGPAAQIVDFALSPDGKAVAYIIATPDGDTWRFDSLWVRSLKNAQAYTVPVTGSQPVSSIWWVDQGLAWAQSGAVTRIELATASGGVGPLLEIASMPGATPVVDGTLDATPEVNVIPVATPRPQASPVSATPASAASPEGTPDRATPVAGTPILSTPAATPEVATPRAG